MAKNPAPDGTVIQMGDGSLRLKKGDAWIPTADGVTAIPSQREFNRDKDTVRALNDVRNKTGFWTAGFVGGNLAGIKGTPQYDLDANIETIKARSAFGELMALKKAGGTLGSVTENELALLQAANANMDLGQSEEQLDANLERFGKAIEGYTPGLTPDAPIKLKTGSRELIPRGAYYEDPKGNIRRNDNGNAGNPIIKRAPGTTAPRPTTGAPAKPGASRRRYNPQTGEIE
jgi:hypothetical protein